MTEIQFDAMRRLVGRYNTTMGHVDVVHGTDECGPYGLPVGWLSIVLFRPEDGVSPHLCKQVIIAGGISPEGNVST